MEEFKIQLEEKFVKEFGRKEIEKQLSDYTQRLILKLASKDLQNDFQEFDLENDKEWQLARELAWNQEKSKYFTQK